MDDSAAGAIFWRDAEFILLARDSHSALWGFSSHWVYIGCTLVFGLNESTREHPLGFRTPLKMAVPSNSALSGIEGDFGYSPLPMFTTPDIYYLPYYIFLFCIIVPMYPTIHLSHVNCLIWILSYLLWRVNNQTISFGEYEDIAVI